MATWTSYPFRSIAPHVPAQTSCSQHIAHNVNYIAFKSEIVLSSYMPNHMEPVDMIAGLKQVVLTKQLQLSRVAIHGCSLIIYCLMTMPWFRWLITSSQGEPFEICGRESGTGTGVLVSLANHHFANAIYSFICHPKNRQWTHHRMQFRGWSFTLPKEKEQYYPIFSPQKRKNTILFLLSACGTRS